MTPVPRSARHMAPAAGVAVERGGLTETPVPSVSATGVSPSVLPARARSGRGPRLVQRVAAVSPATTPPAATSTPLGVAAADPIRVCRKCGTPIEAGRYLRLRHAMRRPAGAPNHYPR